MRHTLLSLFIGLPLLLTLGTERAHACSPLIPGSVWGRAVIPSDGRTNVPTNARVLVWYSSTDVVTDRLQLRSPDGLVPLASSGSPFILIPAQALQPRTRYQVLSHIAQLPCMQDAGYATAMGEPLCTTAPVADAGVTDARGPDGGGTIDADGQVGGYVIATFTTGDGPDVTAPTGTGTISSTLYPEACSGLGVCCTEYSGYRAVLSWSDFSDDVGIATYEVSVKGTSVATSVTGTTATAQILCSGYGPDFMSTFTGVPGVYQVAAVDFAGNRSAPITTTVSVTCGVDAGVSDVASDVLPSDGPILPEAGGATGAGGAAGVTHGTSSSGCACALGTTRREGATASALLAMVFALFLRLHRSHGRRSG